jgi:hypothetical protein
MATESNSATILNTNEPHQTLININVAAQAPLKLTSTNYLSLAILMAPNHAS